MPATSIYLFTDEISARLERKLPDLEKALKRAGYSLTIERIVPPVIDAATKAFLEGITDFPAIKIENRVYLKEDAERFVNLLTSGVELRKILESRIVSTSEIKERARRILGLASSLNISLPESLFNSINSISSLGNRVFDLELVEYKKAIEEAEKMISEATKRISETEVLRKKVEEARKEAIRSVEELLAVEIPFSIKPLLDSIRNEVERLGRDCSNAECLKRAEEEISKIISKINSFRDRISELSPIINGINELEKVDLDAIASWLDTGTRTDIFSRFFDEQRRRVLSLKGRKISTEEELNECLEEIAALKEIAMCAPQLRSLMEVISMDFGRVFEIARSKGMPDFSEVLKDSSIEIGQRACHVVRTLSSYSELVLSSADLIKETMKLMPVYERYVLSALKEKPVVRVDELTKIPAHTRRIVVDELVRRNKVIKIPDDRIAGEITGEIVEMLAKEVDSEAERLERILEKLKGVRPDLAGRLDVLRSVRTKLRSLDVSDVKKSFEELIKAREEVEAVKREVRALV